MNRLALLALLLPSLVAAAPLEVVYDGWIQGNLSSPLGGTQAHATAHRRAARDAGALLLSSGNVLGPSATSEADGGQAVVEIMNRSRYDAAGVGPHDLFAGREALLARAQEADFPWVWTNLNRAGASWEPLEEAAVIERGGRRILILGLVAPSLLGTWPGWDPKWTVRDPGEAAAAAVAAHPDVDHVLVLGTLSLTEASHVLAQVPRIDAVITQQLGNDAGWDFQTTQVHRADGRTVLFTSCYGTWLGHLSLERTGAGRRRSTLEIQTLAALAEDPPDEAAARIVEAAEAADALHAGSALAQLEPEHQRAFARHLLDAMRAEVDAEVAVIHTGAIKAEIPDEEVTRASLQRAFPFPDRVARVRVGGGALRSLWKRRNDSIINDKGLSFAGIEEVDGVVVVNGRVLDDADTYRVATVEYLALGALDLLPPSPEAMLPRSFLDVLAEHFRRPRAVRRSMVTRVARRPIHRIETSLDASFSRLAFGGAADRYQFQNPSAIFTSSEIPGFVGQENRQYQFSLNHQHVVDRPAFDLRLKLSGSFMRLNTLILADAAELLLRREDKNVRDRPDFFGELKLSGTVQDPDVLGRSRPLFLRGLAGRRFLLDGNTRLLAGAGMITRFSTRSDPTDVGFNLRLEHERSMTTDTKFTASAERFFGFGGDHIRDFDLRAELRTKIAGGLSTVLRYRNFRWEDDTVGGVGTRSELFAGLGYTFAARRR